MTILKEEVMKFLPHRDPFLFVDSIEEMNDSSGRSILILTEKILPKDLVGATIIANYHVDPNLDLFKGHFPGRPIFPGVIQIEMMAQAACFGIRPLCYGRKSDENLEVALLKVENAKFRKPILPGMDLKILVKCTKVRGQTHCYDCTILCNNETMSEASLMAAHNI